MRKIIYAAFLFGLCSVVTPTKAQVNVNINIDSQPLWGPVGYDYVRYYYIPEIDVYYDVPRRRYTYYQGNRWITRASLPSRYRHVDMYKTYKVVVNQADPWRKHSDMKRKYKRYAHGHSQRVLRDRHGHHHASKHKQKHSKKSKQKDRGRKKHHKH